MRYDYRSELTAVFESDRICFVRVSELLIGDYLVMINDYENVNRFIGASQPGPFTEEKEISWVRKKLENNETVFSMIDKENGAFIGNIELMDVSADSGELGIAITASMQDRGFGTEAVSALTEYGLKQLGLKRICLRAKPYNARALHVYEKCGFREYDRTDEHVFMAFPE